MQTLINFFLKLLSLPAHVTLGTYFRIAMIGGGIAVLYLLTVRKDEQGKIEDYLKRLWNKIHNLREEALSRHLAFINVTAGTITSAADKLFGARLFSAQAVGVSVCLGLLCLNSYFFIASVKRPPTQWIHLLDTIIVIVFALFPWLIGIFLARKPSLKFLPERQTFIYWWGVFLIAYLLREYVSPFICISCFPAEFHKFLFVMFLVLLAVGLIGTALFTFFVLITRFSLKQLSISQSSAKSVFLLLIGCLPIAVFWLFLHLLLLILNNTDFTSSNPSDPSPITHITGGEYFALGSLMVFALAFFINLAFLLAPILFFSMAALLLMHRLVWPIVERPLNKLNELGSVNHPRVIVLIGLAMILIGIGRIEWLEKALKLAGL